MENNNNMAPPLPYLPAVGVSDKTHISYHAAAKCDYRLNDTVQCYQSIRIVEFVERELNKNEIAKYHKSAELRINTKVSPYCNKVKTGKICPPGFVFSMCRIMLSSGCCHAIMAAATTKPRSSSVIMAMP